MMKYDFDKVIDRTNTCSSKWSNLEKIYGSKDVLPMTMADMDFQSPQPIIDDIMQRAAHGIYGYTLRSPSYYEAIVKWIEKRHGWKINLEWISNSPGVVPALNMAVLAFSHPGDKVIIQSPTYFPFFDVIRNNGRQIVDSPLIYVDGHYYMNFDSLAKKFDSRVKMILLCSPNNPTGTVWKRNDLRQLADLCLKNNVLIVVDEIHSDLVYKGASHVPIASISEEIAQNTLTFIAPSKTFNLPALANSAAIIPNPRLRAQFNTTVENIGVGGGNLFGIVALEAAYRHGEEWLDQLLEYLEGNVDFMLSFLAERVSRIKVCRPDATFLAWLDCRELGIDSRNLMEFMIKQAKVALNDGAMFGTPGEGFQRMNLACPRSTLEEGLTRIEKAVNNS